MEVIHWHANKGPDLLYNGGQFFDGNGNGTPLPNLTSPVPPTRMDGIIAFPATSAVTNVRIYWYITLGQQIVTSTRQNRLTDRLTRVILQHQNNTMLV